MKSANSVRGFGWVVALGGLVACVVLLRHRPDKHPAPPLARSAHPLLPIDVGPDARIAAAAIPAASSSTPAADQAAAPHRRRGIFVNNTPRRRELGWAGLLESPYDTPSSPQDDATTADDPDEVEAEARAALNFVGQDADAGAVWAAAINDSDLTAETRQQLIEALDVSGLPDLQRLTPEYLPLILSRLAIVEQLAPSALDEANATAFNDVHGRLASLAAALERASIAAEAGAPESTPDSTPDQAPDATPQPAPGPTPATPQPGVDPQQPPA